MERMNMRIFTAILSLILFCPLLAYASAPEWTDDTTFLYGTFVFDIEGNKLPQAPINETYLHDGLSIKITNGMPYADRFLILFLLNGHLQPYYIENEKYLYESYELAANSSIVLEACFEDLFIVDADIQCLQIIVIGLLDRLPKNENDPIESFSNMVTIPFLADSPVNAELPMQGEKIALPETVSLRMRDVDNIILFYENISKERIIYPPFKQEIRQSSFTLHIISIGDEQIIQTLVLCDGIPYTGDNLQIPCFYLERGYGYAFSLTIDNLSPGIHQFYAVSCPVSDPMGFSITTTKLRIDVLSE